MARVRELKVKISGDERDLSRAFGKTESATSRWGNKLKTFGKVAALGLAGVGVAAVRFGADFVEAAEESVKIGRQTEAVIKSTGGAARVTAADVGELADKLSLKAGVDDELIQSGENVLLTFRNIRNEVGRGNDIFDQATTLALDMSVAMGTDLQSAVVQVGKALNDPIKGITALQRVGVTFSDTQREQIANFVEAGDLMSAQKVILGELSAQFGGSAEAQATASDKLKVAFGNISEQIGLVLLPYVNQFSDWMLNKGVPLIQNEVIPAVEDFAHWVGDELLPDLKDTGVVLRDDVVPALKALTELLVALPSAAHIALAGLGLLARFGGFGILAVAAKGLGIMIGGALYAAVGVLIGQLGRMASFGGIAFTGLAVAAFVFRDKIGAALLWVRDRGVQAFRFLRDRAQENITGIAGMIQRLPGNVAHALGQLARLFGTAMAAAWRAVTDFVSRIVEAIKSIPRRIGSLGGKIRNAIVGGIGNIDLSPGFDIPGVPFLAHGGIVTRPTLAMVGENGPEAVVPLGRGGGLGPTVNVYVAGSVVVERDLISAVNKGLDKGYRLGSRGGRFKT